MPVDFSLIKNRYPLPIKDKTKKQDQSPPSKKSQNQNKKSIFYIHLSK